MDKHDHAIAPIERNGGTAGELLPLVYGELRALAAARLAEEKPGQTLNPTALVHEVYLRLAGDRTFEGRRHFFTAAAESMRRILIDRARRKQRIIHGGEFRRLSLDGDMAELPERDDRLIALDEALSKLAEKDSLKAQLVELRYFGGLTGDQAAEILGLSPSTADRQWVFARAWLRRELKSDVEPEEI